MKKGNPVAKLRIKCYKCNEIAIGFVNTRPLCKNHYPYIPRWSTNKEKYLKVVK